MAATATVLMKPLLGKLTKLLGDEYSKLTKLLGDEYSKLKGAVRKQASFLRDELSAMQALLEKMELMDDSLDPSAKNWRDHVASYDMENCIDDFMRDAQSQGAGAGDANAGFVTRMGRRLVRRHHIADRIEELKLLAVEANARRERYKIDDCVSLGHGAVVVDPRISAIYKEAAGLSVSMPPPREELTSSLMDSQKLKVVSIVGFGGLGKTTLAKQVYDKIEDQFNCKAFVSVSQRPDMKTLLIGLQHKLGILWPSHAHELPILEPLHEEGLYSCYLMQLLLSSIKDMLLPEPVVTVFLLFDATFA